MQKEVECNENCTFAIGPDMTATLNAEYIPSLSNRTTIFPAAGCTNISCAQDFCKAASPDKYPRNKSEIGAACDKLERLCCMSTVELTTIQETRNMSVPIPRKVVTQVQESRTIQRAVTVVEQNEVVIPETRKTVEVVSSVIESTEQTAVPVNPRCYG
jgi:hypothetical protein